MAKGRGGFIGQDGLNAPDSPTGVSGTAGDAQVEVSWTAPSNVGESAITGYNVQSNDGSGSYATLPSSSYDNKSLDVSGQETTPSGVFFKPDGLSAYICGTATADSVFQYTLTSAWDVSTGSYASKTFDFSSQDTFPMGIFFKPDGTKMYMAGLLNNAIFQYSLSTAWDVSTASYDSTSYSLGSIGVRDVRFKPDGTKMYALGSAGDDALYQYSLSTAWDISTASYDSVTLPDLNDQEPTAVEGAAFNSDGTRVYIIGQGNDTVYQYNLTTGYDLSTGSYSGNSFSAQSQESSANGIYLRSDSKKFYIVGGGGDAIFQYSLPEYPTSSPVTVTGLTNGTSYTFNVWAINAFGWSSPSDASGSVSPVLARALVAGGYDGTGSSNVIDYYSFASTGNATDFGDLTSARDDIAGASSSTRGLFCGGNSNIIDYVTIASTGNAIDFGDLTRSTSAPAACSNSTTAYIAGLDASDTSIDARTIATTGNAYDFGDLSLGRHKMAGLASPTRGIFGGGGDANTVQMDYITLSSFGSGTDFGDLINYSTYAENLGGASNSTRGVFAGGSESGTARTDHMSYVTIATTGNSVDFGNLFDSGHNFEGAASSVYITYNGGNLASDGTANVIQYITIATTGASQDWGDLTVGRQGAAALSSVHGGLS